MYKIIDIGWGNSWWIKICNQKIGKIYALLQIYIYIFFFLLDNVTDNEGYEEIRFETFNEHSCFFLKKIYMFF